MTDIMASIGSVQLKRYPEILERRKELIAKYDAHLQSIKATSMAHYTETDQSSGHLYILRFTHQTEAFRNAIIEKMAQLGIATNVHFKPLPMHTAYKNLGFNIGEYPNAFNMYKNSISLPLHTLLSDDDVDYVCTSLIELMR
jgi:dTDP-4-amino-4,6-dideoxygalactose transaminase